MNRGEEDIIRMLTREIGDIRQVIDQMGKFSMKLGWDIKQIQEELKAINLKLQYLENKDADNG